MSYTYEKISSNKAKLSFVFPAEQFDEAMTKAFQKMRKSINIPGFRKGKAPRSMIVSMYGEGIFYDEAVNLLFPDEYEAAVKELDLHPVDQPEFNLEEIGSGKDLKFNVEVFVRPDVELGEYKGLAVEIAQQEVTDEAIDAEIEKDREKASRTIDIEDRPIQDGDIVNLDYAGTVDGVAFEGGTAEKQTLTIGSGRFIPGFEEQMIGMSIDEEKDLNVTFPDPYQSQELAGKEAVFHVKVNGIQMVERPELDDDFAQDISDFDTFADYKADVVKKLTERVKKNNENIAKNALVDKAVENAKVDIPQAMIDRQSDYMIQEMEMQSAYQGFRLDDYLKYMGMTREALKAQNEGEATRRVKNELVIDAIRKAEGIEPTEEDIEKQIAEQAERYGQDVEDFKKNLTDEQRAYLKDDAAIAKVLDLMMESATITAKAPEAEEKKTEEAAAEEAAEAEEKE
ncbi:MAG: trigger factor [Clostridia bacterium]|nr:trigger factor [Clostridia bacterium]